MKMLPHSNSRAGHHKTSKNKSFTSCLFFLNKTNKKNENKQKTVSQKLRLPKVGMDFSSNIQNVNLLLIIYSSKTKDSFNIRVLLKQTSQENTTKAAE